MREDSCVPKSRRKKKILWLKMNAFENIFNKLKAIVDDKWSVIIILIVANIKEKITVPTVLQ